MWAGSLSFLSAIIVFVIVTVCANFCGMIIIHQKLENQIGRGCKPHTILKPHTFLHNTQSKPAAWLRNECLKIQHYEYVLESSLSLSRAVYISRRAHRASRPRLIIKPGHTIHIHSDSVFSGVSVLAVQTSSAVASAVAKTETAKRWCT